MSEQEIDPREGLRRLCEPIVFECERRAHNFGRADYVCLLLVNAIRGLQAAQLGQGQALAGLLRDQAIAEQQRLLEVNKKREQRRIITLDRKRSRR